MEKDFSKIPKCLEKKRVMWYNVMYLINKLRRIKSMDGSVNYAEYTVEHKSEGKHRVKRLSLISLYVLFLLGGMILFVGILKLWPVGAIMPFLTWIIWGLTWRYAQLEHKCEVGSAKLTISEIYGRKKQVTVFEHLISDFKIIAPMNDEHKAEYENADEFIDQRGSVSSTDAYFAAFEENGKRIVVMFEATNKMVKVLKFYNSKNTVVSELRY